MIWHEEYRMLRNLMRRAPYYSKNLPKQSDLFEWLSLMQHHGSPLKQALPHRNINPKQTDSCIRSSTNLSSLWAAPLAIK